MKKLFVLMSFMFALSFGAFAQKGQNTFGGQVLYGTDSEMFGIGAKFQHNFMDALRGELSGNFYLPKNHVNGFEVNANVHYLFPIASDVTLYPLAGLNYYRWSVSADGVSISDGKLGVNLGVGMDYHLSEKWALSTVLRYETPMEQLVVGVGLNYKF